MCNLKAGYIEHNFKKKPATLFARMCKSAIALVFLVALMLSGTGRSKVEGEKVRSRTVAEKSCARQAGHFDHNAATSTV